MNHDNHRKGMHPITTFLMGSMIGAAAGMLLTPKSGRENRDMLKQRAFDMQDMAKQRKDQALATVDKAVDKSKAALHRGEDKAEDALNHANDKASRL